MVYTVPVQKYSELLNGVEISFSRLVNPCLLHGSSCLGTESLDYLWVMETGLSISSRSVDTGQKPVREINDMPLCCHYKFVFIPKYPKALQQAINTLQALM